MLAIAECKKHLGETNLTDEQVEEFRDALYVLIEQVIDDYIETCRVKI